MILTLALAALQPAPSLLPDIAADNAADIPADFRGDWALENGACAIGSADNGNMRITRSVLQDFEAQGKVERVESLGPRTIRVSLRYDSGKDDTGQATFGTMTTMSLSANGDRLTIGEMSDISRYKRCNP